MHQTVEQLAQMVSARGMDWLQRKILALPEACVPDHPDMPGLATAARVAPILSGFRGRISPLEVIVKRRVSSDMVRQAAQRCLDGARDYPTLQLFQAGNFMTPHDPLWQLACQALADDGGIPLACRLGADRKDRLESVAELALTRPYRNLTSDQVTAYAQIVAQIYELGMGRPRLSDKRSITKIYDTLRQMADWGMQERCTTSVAWTAFCLRLIDPDHDITEAAAELMQHQRSDGSFPARLVNDDQPQEFTDAAFPTLLAILALHSALYRRWRGPIPGPAHGRPLHTAAKSAAEDVIQQLGQDHPTLEQAVVLGRATGRDWIGRLGASHWILTPCQSSRIASLCFRDPISARHVRNRISLHDVPDLNDVGQAEVSWLQGKPVVISTPLPEALMAMWSRAAAADDVEAFMYFTRLAAHFHGRPLPRVIHRMSHRIANAAMNPAADAPLEQKIAHIQRLNLMAQIFEPFEQLAAAA
ncbi:hypothetical protein [Paracoccus sp. R86501]|uniref:hypothetical protein n=1 Tax=Paracoccus sp. R86501 TaxID=3101711 RepID=UPI00366BB1E3